MRGSRPDPSTDVEDEGTATCPYCEGSNTEREHPRGPSRCRSIHFCLDCEEPFEAMA